METTTIEPILVPPMTVAPQKDEWANTLTHCLGVLLAALACGWMLWVTRDKPLGLQLSCLVYGLCATAMFFFSTMSHIYIEPERRNLMRAWDQGVIYLMIAGTYTPFIWHFGAEWKWPLLVFLWSLAIFGAWGKIVLRQRVNAVAVTTYLLLGWIPAVPLALKVPTGCLQGMILGGVVYSVGVAFLKLDFYYFFHAVWHIAVIVAAACHYWCILYYVVNIQV